ncbi:cytochrome c oxidase assembly factor 1 homolog [Babylonia areolata]|uniref:cytochrome c oxidase assembly factor 1 homolog n=1 Tax=Babylonia areolata TaxID=304850 RepID=UPI003FD6A133
MPPSLTKIAVFGGIASVAGALFLTNRIHENLQREEYYRKPVAMMRKYKPAVDLLGFPIRTSRMDLGDVEKNRIDGLIAKLAIPVKGPKDKGTLYVWACREKPGDIWDVTRLDLEVEQEKKRFTFHQTENWAEFPPYKRKT